MVEQEFNRFATDYTSVLNQHVKIGGEEAGYYARYKVEAVRDTVASLASKAGTCILDFGCGVGQSIPFFRELFPQAELVGSDVSPDSLAVAERDYGSTAKFICGREGQPLSISDQSVDIAFTACVLHHIPHSEHAAVLRDLERVLKPGGLLFVFEHNPLNPLTVNIVKNCPFDENAVLIKPGKMKARMQSAGFSDVRVHYRLFIPGWLRWLRPAEAMLTWCPAGGQYYAVGRKVRL